MPTGMRIKDFRLTASEEQKRVLDEILELHRDWDVYYTEYDKYQREIDEALFSLRATCSHEAEVRDFMDLAFDDRPTIPARDMYAEKVKETVARLKPLFTRAVNELGMGNLAYFQRHYRTVVGVPLPSS
jgi:hypothetical protein